MLISADIKSSYVSERKLLLFSVLTLTILYSVLLGNISDVVVTLLVAVPLTSRKIPWISLKFLGVEWSGT